MATYYVYSGATGANTGGSWADAFLTFGQAVSAATVYGDVIKVHKTHTEALAANITYTFTEQCSVVCVDKDNADAPSQMGQTYYIGHKSLNRYIYLIGGTNVYFYGMTFWSYANSQLRLGSSGSDFVFENCLLVGGYSNGGMTIGFSDAPAYVKFINTDISFTWDAGHIGVSGTLEMIGGALLNVGAALSTNGIIKSTLNDPGGSNVFMTGVDLSVLGSSPVVGNAGNTVMRVEMSNCKLGVGFVALGTQTRNNKSSTTLMMYNCASADQHYHFAHYDALGSTIAETGIYANDGALFDGTNHITWKIQTTGMCSQYCPYTSPWIEKFHVAAGAITPSVEILRNDSATPFTDAEVWSEFSYQGTSGFPISSYAKDKVAVLGTPADQDAGAGLSNWTGESGTAWSGKLAPTAAITPLEDGPLRFRVCVALDTGTLYLDPTIRT